MHINDVICLGHFGKWHLSADEDLDALGCVLGSSSSEYECDYDVQQRNIKDAGFDVAEAVYVLS